MKKPMMMLALGAVMLSGTPLSAQTISACVDARKGTLYIPTGECRAGDAELELSIGEQAVPAPASIGFVGFSAGTTTGDAGVWGMNFVCQNTFGPNARMANTEEYMLSNNTSPPIEKAWINLSPVTISGTDLIDFSGFVPSGFGGLRTSCRHWNSASGGDKGAVIDSSSISGINQIECNVLNQVACSGPARAP